MDHLIDLALLKNELYRFTIHRSTSSQTTSTIALEACQADISFTPVQYNQFLTD